MLTIRPFRQTDEEYAWAADLNNAVWTDRPVTPSEWRHQAAAAEPGSLHCERVAELDGRRVGYALYCEPWWAADRRGQVFMDLLVHPERQGRGVGRALYNAVMVELAEYGLTAITARSREDQGRAVAFLARLGFEQTMRFPRSRLALAGLDLDAHAPLLDRLAAHGIRIETLAELRRRDPAWKEKFYELRWAILQDVPSPEPRQKPSFEAFERRVLGHPSLDPEANFIALDGERYVGFSNLWSSPLPGRLNTGLTGVVRGHRRRGVCTALKVHGFRFARAYGATEIETENEEHNPMYQLNLRLGFVPQPAWLNFRKAWPAPARPAPRIHEEIVT